jgi:DNA-binding CsgD family transcriptional regulator
MATDAVPAAAARSRARPALARLARARLDDDSFRYEAAAVLRGAIGFDWWCWPMIDPGARLPTRYAGVDSPPDRDVRLFARLLPQDWDGDPHRTEGGPPSAVTVLSAQTGGDLYRDLLWREILGPAGSGDSMGVLLTADGTAWGRLQVGRDSSGTWFSDDDAEFLAEVAPLLGTRLRDGLRAPYADSDPGPDPGTIVVDRDLSLVAATDQAWRWIERLGMAPANDVEPLPAFIYGVAARAAAAAAAGQPPRPARVRLRTADGHWAVVRAAPLTHGPQAGGGYAITLEAARSEDLAPLLMRAWALTPREREVARLVIDGLSNDDIAAALFISAHTVRDYLKAIFAKVGVSRRRDLAATLAGQAQVGGGRA